MSVIDDDSEEDCSQDRVVIEFPNTKQGREDYEEFKLAMQWPEDREAYKRLITPTQVVLPI